MTTFSMTTNVCVMDVPRIQHTVPSWLRVFGDSLAEIVLVVDETPPSGRLAAQHHGASTLPELYAELGRLSLLDSRVRFAIFDPCAHGDRVAVKWFTHGKPIRCKDGSPILAFADAIDRAQSDLVLRADCDMLFYDSGWLSRGYELLQNDFDIVEPPPIGSSVGQPYRDVSTRAMMMKKSRISQLLPIVPCRTDLARRVHRRLKGLPTWNSFEQMLANAHRRKRLRHCVIDDTSLGFSLHVPTRQDASLPWFHRVVEAVELGRVPAMQIAIGGDFNRNAWSSYGLMEDMAV